MIFTVCGHYAIKYGLYNTILTATNEIASAGIKTVHIFYGWKAFFLDNKNYYNH